MTINNTSSQTLKPITKNQTSSPTIQPITKPTAQPFNLKPDLVRYNYEEAEIFRQPEQ